MLVWCDKKECFEWKLYYIFHETVCFWILWWQIFCEILRLQIFNSSLLETHSKLCLESQIKNLANKCKMMVVWSWYTFSPLFFLKTLHQNFFFQSHCGMISNTNFLSVPKQSNSFLLPLMKLIHIQDSLSLS